MITTSNFSFLEDLKSNNNRTWFEDHRERFLKYQEEVKHLHREVEGALQHHDQIEGGRVYRIYRDVRFSKNKTPYKTYWAGNYRRATQQLRGGYYFQISPGHSYAAGGFFGPNSSDLAHIRKQISQEPGELQQILNEQKMKEVFGSLRGEQVKTAPRGFEIDDPAISLIRHKQFYLEHGFKDSDVLSTDFSERLNVVFKTMRPFLDYMSLILTTDLNGESLLN